MKKLTKIGASALAGSLVAMSAHAEVSVSGGASIAIGSTHDGDATYYYQNDSITFTYSGETDGGLTVTTSLELDGGANASSSFDNRSISIASEEMGTITFSGHGGDTVMSGWDDMTPTAYEEPWALTKNQSDTATGAGNLTIAGQTADNTWRYDSPVVSGAQFSIAYISADSGTTVTRSSSYSDMGVKISPEMVEGLTVGYATAELEDTATTSIDHETLFVKYAIGGFTLGYQTHDADGPTAAKTDESTTWGVSYAVNDDMTISYGERDYDDNTATAGANSSEQQDSGFSISYTMGGMTVAGHMNQSDNVSGVAATDTESYEFALTFAF
jgi:outer membrane protein OmpU